MPFEGTGQCLVTPLAFVDGRTPAHRVASAALEEAPPTRALTCFSRLRVNADGFALMLPNGMRDGEGNRFWNPMHDRCCEGGI